MATVGAVTAAAIGAGGLGHAGHGFAAALGEEVGDLAFDVLAAAVVTGHGQIGLGHGTEDFELVAAILTDVFVNGHEETSW